MDAAERVAETNCAANIGLVCDERHERGRGCARARVGRVQQAIERAERAEAAQILAPRKLVEIVGAIDDAAKEAVVAARADGSALFSEAALRELLRGCRRAWCRVLWSPDFYDDSEPHAASELYVDRAELAPFMPRADFHDEQPTVPAMHRACL